VSNKSRHRKNQPAGRRFPWPWLAALGALVLIAGGLVWVVSRPQSTADPQANGSPKLVVDQTSVDEGYVQFNVPVRSTFRLSNAGDGPLQILGEPRVELVEGC
jgi:hypothetical protein